MSCEQTGCTFPNGTCTYNCYDAVAFVCEKTSDYFEASTSKYGADNSAFYDWIILASFFSCMYLFLMVWNDTKLQEHPMNIFGQAAFLLGSLFWIYLMEPHLCPQNDWTLYYAVTFPYRLDTTDQQQYRTMYYLYDLLGSMRTFFWVTTISFNICLCYDLVAMIKYPFVPQTKRIVSYYLFSYAFGIVAFVEKHYLNEKAQQSWLSISEGIAYLVFFFAGIWSTVFALKRLSGEGVNPEVKGLITKRHIAYIFCTLVCNLYLLIQEIQQIRTINNHSVMEGKWWINGSEILYFSQGVWLTLCRFFEPYFLERSWENIKHGVGILRACLFCCPKPPAGPDPLQAEEAKKAQDDEQLEAKQSDVSINEGIPPERTTDKKKLYTEIKLGDA